MFKAIDNPFGNCCSTQCIPVFAYMQMAEPEQSPHVSTSKETSPIQTCKWNASQQLLPDLPKRRFNGP